jgi:hypothetical protein
MVPVFHDAAITFSAESIAMAPATPAACQVSTDSRVTPASRRTEETLNALPGDPDERIDPPLGPV